MFSPLLVPCDDPHAMDAALLSGAGVLVLDLGDAGGPGNRAARRRTAVGMLARAGGPPAPPHRDASPHPLADEPQPRPAPTRPMTIVRVASVASGLLDDDLDAVMAGAPSAVLLPGAVGARDLQHLAAKLAVREAEHGLSPGRTRVAAMAADTAAAALALPTLPGAGPRLLALGWDPAALASDLGVGTDASPVRAVRDLLLIAAAAACVPAFDCGLASDDLASACRAARRDGFAGRLARGPEQVPAIAAAFGARARR